MNVTRSTLIGLLSASLLCLAPPLLHAETATATATATVNARTKDFFAIKRSADAAIAANDWAQSLTLLDRYLALKPDDAKVHRMRGSVLRELGQNDEAIGAYRKATELDPEDADGWDSICWTYITLNRPLDARPFCEKAVSLDQTSYAIMVNFGHTFLLSGDTKTANRWYRETLLFIESEDGLKQGPLADFDMFIGKGWQVKESRKAKTWFEKEGKAWLARSAPVNKLRADLMAAFHKNNYALSIALHEQRLPLLIALLGKSHPRVAGARDELTITRILRAEQIENEYYAAMKNEDHIQSIVLLEQRLRLLKTVFGKDNSIVAEAREALADARKQRAKQLQDEYAVAKKNEDNVQPIALLPVNSTTENIDALATKADQLFFGSQPRYDEALALYRQVLAAREKENGPDSFPVGTSLIFVASALMELGKFSEAEPLFIRALAISEKTEGPEHSQTRRLQRHLADIYYSMGRYAQAESLYLRELANSEHDNGPEHPATGAILNILAKLYQDMGLYARAEPLYIRILAINEGGNGSELTYIPSLNSLASLYLDMGQYARAEPLVVRALAISEKAEGPEHPTTSYQLNKLAVLYQAMGQYARAEPLFVRALAISENTRGSEHTVTGTILNNLASLYGAMGQYARAEPLFVRALAISENAYGPEHPSTGSSLDDLANLYHATGQISRAEPLFLRAWRITSSAERPKLVWSVQNSLRAFYAKTHPNLAIWYGKQAVNTLQTVRANNTSLDKDTQKSFLQKNESTYKELADLLFGQGRLMEGQQVLAMLKEAEYFDFIQRNSSADPRKTQASFNSREKPWVDRHDKISGQLAALSEERESLIKQAQFGLTLEEQSRKDVLDANLADAHMAFDAFVVELKREFTQSESAGYSKAGQQRGSGERNFASLSALDDLGHGAVMLHYLMTDKRLWILLTTPTDQLKRESAISEADLNKQIGEYREAIARKDPKVNELGKALYDIIIAPVADDLKQADAQTLMLSLDGGLRYLPMAALYDGEKYLAQRYRLAIYTTAATSQLNVPPKANWNLAGFGLTRAVTVGEQHFIALTSVRGELEGIKQDMNGSVKLDYDFTAKTLQSGLNSGSSVVHLASHFAFRPGNETDSFLLMGDGSPLSLAAVRNYSFTNVDLLTLSACETAVGGGKDANGREVESFGVLAQKQGAKAVIATLWPVDDQSTGQFMQLFYGFHQKNPGMTKAEAIQKAQLAFIEGRIGPALAEVSRGGVRRADGSKAAAAVTSTDHPYYWAPFILMGNWL